jgi:TupA-like ATPgrasp
VAAPFSERIVRRRRLWWHPPRPGTGRTLGDAAHRLVERRTVRRRDDSDEAWRCCNSWPRTLVDKWNGREFAARFGCPLPELYWHGGALATPPFESLPEHFVIRPTRGANRDNVRVVTQGRELLLRESATTAELRTRYSFARRVLTPVPLVIEEFVRSEDGSRRLPPELKCHVFGGAVAAVELVERVVSVAHSRRYYTPSWETFPDPMNTNMPISEIRSRPEGLEPMVELAARIGAELGTYMRIDFFATDRGCVFNEFSTLPVLGQGFTPYCDELFGALWEEHCPGAI